MEELLSGATSNYRVKNIETIMKGSDVQARVFTLAQGDTIPWHFHPIIR
jgi:quercetin dioxygenase-like cupin family protein